MVNKARLAQSVERKALNLVVVGSSPTVGDLSFFQYDVVPWWASFLNNTTSLASLTRRGPRLRKLHSVSPYYKTTDIIAFFPRSPISAIAKHPC